MFGQTVIQLKLRNMWGHLNCVCFFSNAPLNFSMHGPYCTSSHIISSHCTAFYWFAHFTFLYVCWFLSSRHPEQLEQEYEYHPQEDPACTTTTDLTGELSPLHLFYSFHSRCSIVIHMMQFCSSHVSYSTCYPYELCFLTDTYHPLFVVWQAFRVIAWVQGFVVISISSGYVG
jgi:hypothetical protein